MISKIKKAIALFLNKLFKFDFGISSQPGLQPIRVEAIKNPYKSGVMRNLSCICGSGKKLKRCCGLKDELTIDEYMILNEKAKNRALVLKQELEKHKRI